MSKKDMNNYVDYILDVTTRLLAIDSPTGYTKEAALFVMDEYKKLGYDPKMTVKGGVLVEIGGEDEENGLLLAAHTDTLGAMVAEVKSNGNLRVTPLGGMNPNNAEAENCRIITKFDGTHLRGRSSWTMRAFMSMAITMTRSAHTMAWRLCSMRM